MEPDNHSFGKENIFQTTLFFLYTNFPGYNCIESCHILLTLWFVCDSLIPWFVRDIQIQTYSDLRDQNHHILSWRLHFVFKTCVLPFFGQMVRLERTAPFHKFSTFSWMHLGLAIPGQAFDGCYPSFCVWAPQTRLLGSTECTYSDPPKPQNVVWPAS